MKLYDKYKSSNLLLRIVTGLVIGASIGALVNFADNSSEALFKTSVMETIIVSVDVLFQVLGNLFIGALRGIAPVLVFFLVSSALIKNKKTGSRTLRRQMALYAMATFIAAFTAVVINWFANVELALPTDIDKSNIDQNIQFTDVIVNVFNNIVENPFSALCNANFLGILFWAILFGSIGRSIGSENVKNGLASIADILTNIVRVIIEFAPLGICGLIYISIASNGVGIFTQYGMLLFVYIVIALTMFLIINPLLVFAYIRRNPYPLVFRAIKEVGITAFFLRSSAANIPMNMKFCRKLGLDAANYSISIPLGSTINMEGAAITIITLTLACCKTLGIDLEFGSVFLLSCLATVSAIGASGVSGGSILLVPMACSLFGISGDIANSVVAVGFIIGVVQDSVETALNSSTDGLFTATIQFYERIKENKPLHKIVGGTLDDIE